MTQVAQLHSHSKSATPLTLPTRAIAGLIRVYQLVRGERLSPCRYTPSCSHYALEALERHGALRGSWLSVRRIARCNPFGRYGFNPVPE